MKTLEWFVDASFALHPNFRSPIGATMKFQGGIKSPIQMSVKQKLNTDSSTTGERGAVHQELLKVLWVPLFLSWLVELAIKSHHRVNKT